MFFYIIGIFMFFVVVTILIAFLYRSLKRDIDHLISKEKVKEVKEVKHKEGQEKEKEEKRDEEEEEKEKEEEEENRANEHKKGEEGKRAEDLPSAVDNFAAQSFITEQPHSGVSLYEPLLGSTSDGILYQNVGPVELPRPLNMIPMSNNFIRQRDAAVINDPLYPPLNRSSTDPHDNYRLVGYLVGEESTSDSWQLFGRKVNNTRSQFYARPTDKNIDMKIQIEDHMMPSRSRIRDLDNLPGSVTLDHPLFTSGSYIVTENPRTDFNSLYF